jgi:hypothetical protein
MPWMTATFAASEGYRQGILQVAFTKLWMSRGAPTAVIMYSAKHEPDCRCFFSPGAVEIAHLLLLSFGAIECSEPDIRELRPLVNVSARPHPPPTTTRW